MESPLYTAVSVLVPKVGKVNEQLPVPTPEPGPEPGVSVPVQLEPLPVTVTLPVGPDAPAVSAIAEATLKFTVTG